MTSYNDIIVTDKVSLPFPLGMNRALPLDARSYFTDFENARAAVHNAVELDRDENGNFILPPEVPEDSNENGGTDSEYYYGQTIAVVTENGEKADLYIVVKKYDLEGTAYGDLEVPNYGFFSQYLSENEIAQLAQDTVETYVSTNLNTECIDGYVFTNELDNCGNEIPSQGMYAYGLKENNGRIELCDYARRILAFDPSTTYNKNTNPLATVKSVDNRLNKKVDKQEGYGLSQNDFSDCLMEKLANLPNIRLEGDKLIINGKAFKLTEWYEEFDFYAGWMNLGNRTAFAELTTDELVESVTDTGNVSLGGRVFRDVSCGRNTFFLMTRKNISIDGIVEGYSSELISNGLSSPIRSDVSSILTHGDVTINNIEYTVIGLHTHHTNSSDKVRIVLDWNE